MSVVISGALIDGAGISMSGCHIILKSRVNTSEVVMRTVADVVTGNCGEYCFEAQTGKYCVYLKQGWRDEYCVGDIAVYDDSKPGTLNDFLTALDEGDLKPDVVKRFEEMVAQAQQGAETATESERQAGQHVADAQQIKSDCQTLADNVQQNAEAVAEDKQRVAQLASEVEQNAGQVQQGVQSVTDAVKQAQQAADDSASSAEESKNNADNAALSEQNAKSCADNAAGSAQQTAQDVKATAAARDDAERFADEAQKNAAATAEDRNATAEDVRLSGQNAEESAQSAKDAEMAADSVRGFISDHLAVSTRYSVTEANRQFLAMQITEGRYSGIWRYLNPTGGINWYFLFLAMYESEGKAFSLRDRIVICEKAFRLGITVPFMPESLYEAGQRLMINDKLLFVNVAGVTGENVPDISNVSLGEFVYTGSAVLECLGNTEKQIPSSWSWFFVDVAADLYSPVAPDSTDSYPSLWFACIAEIADAAWLSASSGIGDYSRWHVIRQVAEYNILRQINVKANLVNVFQGDIAPGNTHYAQCFCQDNAEVWAGLRALVFLAGLVNDSEAASQYEAAMETIKQGLLGLFVPAQSRFKTYYDESDYPAEPSDGRFVQKDRFSVAPWRFGVLGTLAEQEQYGLPVLDAIQRAYPDLFTSDYAGIDTFAMSDFFAFVAKVTASQTAATTALRRLQIRKTAAITISDITAAMSVSSWGTVPRMSARDFMRINGRSVIEGGDITFPERNIRHIKPANNAQVVVDTINSDTVLFIDSDSALSYLQFRIMPGLVDGCRLSIIPKEDVTRTSFLTQDVQISDAPEAIFAGKAITFTYNATMQMWCRNYAPVISTAATNLLKEQSESLLVDGTHPVIPKVVVSTLNSSLSSFKSLPDGSRVYAMTLDVSNPIKKSSVGGVGIAVSAIVEPRYLYQNQSRQYIPAQYFVSSVSATASTITIKIQIVMPDIPYYALDMSTLGDAASADNGALPCVLLVKAFAGTTLRQNGMA
ncbi:prophage tail fiber N-terminal domain-containing protein [Escherichia coli]|uniref:prophage tail fiber N-terminal domain-containing protein n=1 Tax=Escherichia coli TaxID=562 RepID=UPI0019D1405A|nr:prophage tail fiber N-terminal domain-containing protein [Escherichia coli]MBN6451315.1 prophage tail fiber N-terminal domain-containing protein [Escherichia coli]